MITKKEEERRTSPLPHQYEEYEGLTSCTDRACFLVVIVTPPQACSQMFPYQVLWFPHFQTFLILSWPSCRGHLVVAFISMRAGTLVFAAMINASTPCLHLGRLVKAHAWSRINNGSFSGTCALSFTSCGIRLNGVVAQVFGAIFSWLQR